MYNAVQFIYDYFIYYRFFVTLKKIDHALYNTFYSYRIFVHKF